MDASGVVFELPVKLPQYLVDEITDMALKAYKALGMKGMAITLYYKLILLQY